MALVKFRMELEVSSRYHDWRRARIGLYVNCVRAISLAGAVVTLTTLFANGRDSLKVIVIANGLVALVTIIDLVFQSDAATRRHDALYRRFKDLQANVARDTAHWHDRLPEWQAEAQIIRMDEPPVFWAIYAQCWNQAVEKFFHDTGQLRQVSLIKLMLGDFVQFRPNDFPLRSG